MYAGVPMIMPTAVSAVCASASRASSWSSSLGNPSVTILATPKSSTLAARATTRQQDVLRLEVAVQDAIAVGGANRGADGGQDAHRLGGVEPALALQHVAEVLAADELHDQIGATVGERAVVVDGDDRRMLQARDDLRLAPEPAPGLRVVAGGPRARP